MTKKRGDNMGIFGKLFKKKMEADLYIYDISNGTWKNIGRITDAKSVDDMKREIDEAIEKGVISESMGYKVVDKKGNILLMKQPDVNALEDESEGGEEYRIEYRTSPVGRWSLYDKYPEQPQLEIIESLANSGKLPAGTQIRLVRMVGKRKERLYDVTVKGLETPKGLVSGGEGVVVIDLKGLEQLKQTIEGVKKVRDDINEALGTGTGGANVPDIGYEGKPPWYLHPGFLKPIMDAVGPYLIGAAGGNISEGKHDKKKLNDLDKYL